MRFVVLGTGLLGHHVALHLEEKVIERVVLGHDAIDALGGLDKAVAAHAREGDVVVNAAALTNVDACEDREDEANLVNGEMPGRIAATCKARGARFIHISTDAIHDVTNAYARSKALGEARIREAVGEDALILRTATNFGPHPKRQDFVRFVLKTLREKGEATVLTDMWSSPTYTPDAAAGILALARADVTGTHQIVNHPRISRYDFAVMVQREWGVSGTIKPARFDDFKGFKAPRPRDISMPSTVDEWHKPLPLDACLADYHRRAGTL